MQAFDVSTCLHRKFSLRAHLLFGKAPMEPNSSDALRAHLLFAKAPLEPNSSDARAIVLIHGSTFASPGGFGMLALVFHV